MVNDAFAGGPTRTEFSAITEQLYTVLGENPSTTLVIELKGVVGVDSGREVGEGVQ